MISSSARAGANSATARRVHFGRGILVTLVLGQISAVLWCLVLDNDIDATILGSSSGRVILSDRVILAERDCRWLIWIDSLWRKVISEINGSTIRLSATL
jgi:hypothetical protein